MSDNIDLREYLIHKDEYGEWYAGMQLQALHYYLSEKVVFLAEYEEGDYDGECFAILKFDDVFVLWRASFGSCSGCDCLEGENGYEYIKDTLQEGNTKQFKSLEDAKKYIEKTENYFWNSFPRNLFNEIKVEIEKPIEESVNKIESRFSNLLD